MGRIQSTRITDNTNVVPTAESPCVYNGFILSPTGALGAGAARTISVYSDNTGTGTTNLIARYSFDAGLLATDSKQHHYTDGILCRSGLRIECDDWTGLELFVLHS
tara:strand:+ start:320 stop:637 length:318 start_codon:yes stop_codon:yes gene_type:complete